tara:strand:- start:457 stop:699 length:243 start_codon:yes stop_codon:yes gene_type:complete
MNRPFISYEDKKTAHLLSMDALGTLETSIAIATKTIFERVDVNSTVSSNTLDDHLESVETDITTPCSKHTKETNQKKKKR